MNKIAQTIPTRTVEIMMDKTEAKEKDLLLMDLANHFASDAGEVALDIKRREGWRALGFKSWRDYCTNVNERLTRDWVDRTATKALVEENIGERMFLRHALELSRIDDAEGQREVYAKVTKAFTKPTAQNFEASVERWLIDHKKSTRKSGERAGAWAASDLEDDEELAKAFDKIQEVYGSADRKAFQDGTIGWTRKDIVGLANFPASKMKEIHYLIMEEHWGLEKCFKFVNATPVGKTKADEMIRHALGTIGLRYVFSLRGWDFTVTACHELAKKIRG